MAIVRLQVEIDSEQMGELERLRELGGLRTKKDLVNNALTLLRWAAKQKADGCTIVSINDDNDDGSCRELQMPFLEDVAANSRHIRPQEPPSDAGTEVTNRGRVSRGDAQESKLQPV